MIQSPEINIIDILCSLDETLSNNSIVMRQTTGHQYLIHQASLKILDWLKSKLHISLQLHLDSIEPIDDHSLRFTLVCRDFAQTLFFNVTTHHNGKVTLSSNVDFNSDIYIQEAPQAIVA